jgi:hypothetical protein
MYSLALIIFVVSEKKAFEHFPIGSNVNLFPAVAAILDFRSAYKTQECSLDGPLQSLGFLFRYKMEDGGYSRI